MSFFKPLFNQRGQFDFGELLKGLASAGTVGAGIATLFGNAPKATETTVRAAPLPQSDIERQMLDLALAGQKAGLESQGFRLGTDANGQAVLTKAPPTADQLNQTLFNRQLMSQLSNEVGRPAGAAPPNPFVNNRDQLIRELKARMGGAMAPLGGGGGQPGNYGGLGLGSPSLGQYLTQTDLYGSPTTPGFISGGPTVGPYVPSTGGATGGGTSGGTSTTRTTTTGGSTGINAQQILGLGTAGLGLAGTIGKLLSAGASATNATGAALLPLIDQKLAAAGVNVNNLPTVPEDQLANILGINPNDVQRFSDLVSGIPTNLEGIPQIGSDLAGSGLGGGGAPDFTSMGSALDAQHGEILNPGLSAGADTTSGGLGGLGGVAGGIVGAGINTIAGLLGAPPEARGTIGILTAALTGGGPLGIALAAAQAFNPFSADKAPRNLDQFKEIQGYKDTLGKITKQLQTSQPVSVEDLRYVGFNMVDPITGMANQPPNQVLAHQIATGQYDPTKVQKMPDGYLFLNQTVQPIDWGVFSERGTGGTGRPIGQPLLIPQIYIAQNEIDQYKNDLQQDKFLTLSDARDRRTQGRGGRSD